jgi:hypothetical protein
LNPLLIRYAGCRQPDGSIVGDPQQVEREFYPSGVFKNDDDRSSLSLESKTWIFIEQTSMGGLSISIGFYSIVYFIPDSFMQLKLTALSIAVNLAILSISLPQSSAETTKSSN